MEEKLLEDLKKAMKENNTIDKNTIQYLRAQILKARNEALALYEKAERTDLMEQTYKEIACINRYLPKALNDNELQVELQKIVDEIGNDKTKFGQIMGIAKTKFGNRADGKRMSEILKTILGM